MANGFDYESPLNRLLNVTIPEAISGQLTREEGRRRFDKQLELESQDRQDRIARENQERIRQNELFNEEKRQFNRNLNVQINANTLEQKRQDRAEITDRTTKYLNSVSNENDIGSRISRLEGFKKSNNIDDILVDSEINRLKGVKKEQEDDLIFYRESNILDEKTSNQLERLVGKINFNERVNKFYELSVSNKTLEEKKDLEVLKLQYDNNAKRIRDLDEIVSSGIGDTAGAKSELNALVTAQSDLISTFKGTPTGKKPGVGDNAKKTVNQISKSDGSRIDIQLVSELNNLSTDASFQDTQAIFEKYGVTDINDQAEIIDALERDDVVPGSQTTSMRQTDSESGLTPQQQARLARVRRVGQGDIGGVNQLLESLLNPVAEAGQRAGEAVRNIPAIRGNMFRPAG